MTISQREARRLKKRVAELESADEAARRSWITDWPGGAEIAREAYEPTHTIPAVIKTARLLGHAVVVVPDGRELRFIAVKQVAR